MTTRHIYIEKEKKWWEEKRYQCTRCHIYRVKYSDTTRKNRKIIYFTSWLSALSTLGKSYMNCTEYQSFENERMIKDIIE